MGLSPIFAIFCVCLFVGTSWARTEQQDINALKGFRDSFGSRFPMSWPLEAVDPCDNLALYRYTIQCLAPAEPYFPWRVGGINLNCVNLKGSFPNLANFTALRSIDLSNNFLNGTLSTSLLGPRVTILNLYNNSFSGTIPSFANTTVEEVYLSRNLFTGTIPTFSPSLKVLSLNSNNLTGGIPTGLFEATNLTQLFLGNTTLGGTIPSEIQKLQNLQIFSAWRSRLNGTVPSILGNLAHLRFLYVDRNNLTGTIPAALSQLSDMRIIYLRDNKLTGSIPTTFNSLTKLTALSVANNQLTGTIPNNVGEISSLVLLHLYLNRLTGTIPSSIGTLQNLTTVDLSSNLLNGTIPASFEALMNKTKFYFLNLAYNSLTGNFSSTFLGKKPNTTAMIDVRQNLFTCGTLPNWCNQLGNGMCVTSRCLLAPSTTRPITTGKRSQAPISVTLKWSPSLEMERSKDLVYEAELTEAEKGNFSQVYKGIDSTATIDGLTQGKNYHVRIRAVNMGDVGPWSPVLLVSP